MTKPDVPSYLRSLAAEAVLELWRVASQGGNAARLVLPRYRNGKLRVSEQEARSIVQRLIASHEHFYFSIETPTPKITGKGRSGLHDLSLHSSYDGNSIEAHAEFKQGYGSGEAGIKVIEKDLIKLIDSAKHSSAKHSLWFHSFPKLTKHEFDKLRVLFLEALDRAFQRSQPPPEARVVLAFCAVMAADAWLAGPVSWAEVCELIDRFPFVASPHHPAWERCKPPVSMPKLVEKIELVDLEEPMDPEEPGGGGG